MSYNSGSNLSIAELKRLNDRDLAEAADVECTMTVTARNWTAVLNLLNRSLQQMKVMETQMERIMTKETMEEYLDIQAGEAMGQREYMEAALEQFRQQAGNISERLSSDTKEMVRKTQSELWDMKREASSHISSLTDTQDKRMKRLTRVIGILAVGQTLFLVLPHCCGDDRRNGGTETNAKKDHLPHRQKTATATDGKADRPGSQTR